MEAKIDPFKNMTKEQVIEQYNNLMQQAKQLEAAYKNLSVQYETLAADKTMDGVKTLTGLLEHKDVFGEDLISQIGKQIMIMIGFVNPETTEDTPTGDKAKESNISE